MDFQRFIFAFTSLGLLIAVLTLIMQKRKGLRAALEEIEALGTEVDEAGEALRERSHSEKVAKGKASGTTFGVLDESIRSARGIMRYEIERLRQDRETLQAILTSMTQGVIALDTDERVMSLNPAAVEMLETDLKWAAGRPIQEVLRSRGLQEFVSQTLEAGESATQSEITLPPNIQMVETAEPGELTDRILIARGTGLCDGSGKRIGILVVLNDITELRRLEQVRQDFVANVSHELRTPITAIRGSVETLLDGSEHDTESVDRFLSVIGRHADRLSATLEDLLSLARLDFGTNAGERAREWVDGRKLAERSAEACRAMAERRSATIHVTGEDEIRVFVDAGKMEKALVNLIDNAIKYNAEGGDITVRVETVGRTEVHGAGQDVTGGEVVFSVEDHGIGIPREHQARIFERFYRVDKGRSRDVGGTGLGLSIVKHVAMVHGGRVSVESEPGLGSTFRIHLAVQG